MKTNRPMLVLIAAALMAVSLVACGAREHEDGSSASVDRHIKISDGRVGAIAADRRIAWVDAAGGIEVEGQLLSLDQAQRDKGSNYHLQAMALREQALQVGRHGIKIANTAVSEIIAGLANGNSDQIENTIDQQSAQIDDQVQKMCDQLARLRQSQDALSKAVPAFLEYATIDASTAENCGPDVSRNRS